MKALILVDIQNDFLPGGALPVPQGNTIIPLLNTLQKLFPCIVATKDWHPLSHISFASTHGKNVGEVIEVEGVQQYLWPDHCIQGSKGAEFSHTLETSRIQKVIFKGVDPKIDSYSAFYDNAHLRSTELEEYLKNLDVEEIYIAGLAIDYCIKYSVRDARQLGFQTYVVMDACKGIDLIPGDCARAFEEMRAFGAHLLTTKDLLSKENN